MKAGGNDQWTGRLIVLPSQIWGGCGLLKGGVTAERRWDGLDCESSAPTGKGSWKFQAKMWTGS